MMVVFDPFGHTARKLSTNQELLAKADWGGMLLFGAGLALIYTGLDQGNRLDWFESGTVTALIAGGCSARSSAFLDQRGGRPPSHGPTSTCCSLAMSGSR